MARIGLDYVHRPKAAERFVSREEGPSAEAVSDAMPEAAGSGSGRVAPAPAGDTANESRPG